MAHREVNRAEQNILAEMRTYFASGATRTLSVRKAALVKLRETILQYEAEILHALTSDLGRPAFETYAFEIAPVLQEIETLEKNLDSWTKPKKVKTPLLLFSAKTEVRIEPYGLVLVIAPWNYPFHLLMMPVAGAVACGNVVAVKPSRRAPIVQTILSDVFPDVWVSVFPQISLEEKYDYIFFTGGIETGRKIAAAAAQHLTPITLELGGKNPCIVDETANLNVAARRIAWGKCVNAGQTCVAPDYLLVHDSVRDMLVNKIAAEITAFYGENPVTHQRILKQCGTHNPRERKLAPTLLAATCQDPITRREIFGPILPVITWNTISDLDKLLSPTPLALYLFTEDTAFAEHLISLHPSGGVCINDCMIQVANNNAPFGGVGTSGMGCYHAQHSIETFSRKRTVITRKYSPDPSLRYPPYSKSVLENIRKLRRILF